MTNTPEREVEVAIVRPVRYFRLMLVGGVIGLGLTVIVTLTLPIAESSHYTMPQIAGFMAIIGAVIGVTAGALLGLILGLVAKKKRGSGVAVQSDVQ